MLTCLIHRQLKILLNHFTTILSFDESLSTNTSKKNIALANVNKSKKEAKAKKIEGGQ